MHEINDRNRADQKKSKKNKFSKEKQTSSSNRHSGKNFSTAKESWQKYSQTLNIISPPYVQVKLISISVIRKTIRIVSK